MKKLIGIILGCLLSAAAVVPASAQSSTNTATLSWQAVTTDMNNNPLPAGDTVSYNVYTVPTATATSGGTLVQSGITALTAAYSGMADGSTVCYVVTAVASGQESAYSNAACKTFPFPKPAAPTLTVK